jgi:8-oxo-dGTP diphosphatase
MTVHDGNGWTRCSRGHRHWGRHGAAGLLLAAPGGSGMCLVLLQQRSWWGSYGGAWGPPGGARDSHESAVKAALREAAEECAIETAVVSVHAVANDDHGGWTYQTVLGNAAAPLPAAAVSEETSEVAWVPAAEVERLRLHPGFAEQWPVLRTALSPLTVVVDAANVMGSRPDGWWRDRAGAARRLIDQIGGLAATGVRQLPDSVPGAALERWFPRFVIVVEGAASAAEGHDVQGQLAGQIAGQRAGQGAGQVRVVSAPGSGDDEIVRQADVPGKCLVVTADRALRARCQARGAWVTGPHWLLAQL